MTDLPRRARRIDPWLLDVALTGVLAVVGVAALFLYSDSGEIEYQDGDAAGVLVVLGLTAPLLLRRRWPFAFGLVTAAGLLSFTTWDYAMPTAAIIMLIAVYTAAAYSTVWRSIAVLLSHVGVFVAYALATSNRHPREYEFDLASAFLNAIVFVAAWGIGRAVSNRRLYMAELEDRAHQLEITREAEVRAAIADERSRIARELHDVVAHHVSVMTVQAAGARRSLGRHPERSSDALRAIEETGRSALSEMRRVVGVLRAPRMGGLDDEAAAALTPQPGLAELDNLAEQIRAAGLPVRIDVEGAPSTLPLGVDLAAFRVIQEALTNTIKHAGPSTATVTVRYLPSDLHIHISDDGRGLAAALDGRRPGQGLLGMRERVALYGGTLAVGPRRGGGFEVRATIPYDSER